MFQKGSSVVTLLLFIVFTLAVAVEIAGARATGGSSRLPQQQQTAAAAAAAAGGGNRIRGP